ncbi:MAG: hypothetical protein HYS57_00020 [Parcubacteria group bacterium]|nr:hypothetical protein [Parcubacteria group bacterium]
MSASEELVQIYADAYAEGIWLSEFSMGDYVMAGAGSVEKLTEAEKRLGTKINTNLLTIEDCIVLGAEPGEWKTTREEACRSAIEAFRRCHPI